MLKQISNEDFHTTPIHTDTEKNIVKLVNPGTSLPTGQSPPTKEHSQLFEPV